VVEYFPIFFDPRSGWHWHWQLLLKVRSRLPIAPLAEGGLAASKGLKHLAQGKSSAKLSWALRAKSSAGGLNPGRFTYGVFNRQLRTDHRGLIPRTGTGNFCRSRLEKTSADEGVELCVATDVRHFS
jgi:hypothetical protein